MLTYGIGSSKRTPTDKAADHNGRACGELITVAHNRLQEHGRLRGLIAVAAIIAVAILAAASPRTPRGVAIALASADAIEIAQGISITPAPGWTLGNRDPNWVALNNADTSAQMRVTVKPAGGTDVVAVLQSDVNQFTNTASAILSNVKNLSAPATKTLQSANFQQEAFTEYTADVLTQEGTIPVIGTFSELLNTSNGRSAFIDFRQDNNATTQAAGDGGTMIDSML
jgi:hypothetical protein